MDDTLIRMFSLCVTAFFAAFSAHERMPWRAMFFGICTGGGIVSLM